jgi:hypothetical protein
MRRLSRRRQVRGPGHRRNHSGRLSNFQRKYHISPATTM